MNIDIKELIKISRVTLAGSDDGQFPVQQVEFMDNPADAFIVFPYGMHANVANDALGLLFAANGDEQELAALMTSAKDRIKGLAQNEVIFFHPKSKTFTHYRNSGDLDVSVNGSENVTITKNWNILVGGDANISVGGDSNLIADGDINSTSGGDTNITSTGNANVTAAAVNVTTPISTFSGQIICTGLSIVSGGSAVVAGSITATGDVVGAGISLSGHGHLAGTYMAGGDVVTGTAGTPT
jgi:hypothetical protein